MRTCDFCKKPIQDQSSFLGKISLSTNSYDGKSVTFDACDECIQWAKGILRSEMGNR